MLADIRYALRGLRGSPGFALAAILSLALGIGANTAIFSLVNAVLLRRLPVRDADRLVVFAFSAPTAERYGANNIGQAIYKQIRDKNTSLEGFAAITGSSVALSDGDGAERVDGSAVSANFFQTLGVSAVIGRVPTPEDGDQVCVISYELWMRRFHRDPGVAGRKILIDGQPVTVLGVTPKEFHGVRQGSQTDVSYPLAMAGPRMAVRAFGRLKTGVTAAQAQAELDALYHQIQKTRQPGILAGIADTKVILEPGSQGFSGLREQYGRPLLMLMVVVGLVLLIACANIANLLMARASGRTREIAVRMALGAGRSRLVRQVIMESALLTTFGVAAGVALAYWTDRALIALTPSQWGGSALIVEVRPDWRVLLFTLGSAILVSLLSALGPAFQSTRPELSGALKGDVSVRGPGRFSLMSALVVVQVAFSMVLLIGAGLFLRSLRNLRSIDPGFDPERLIVLTIDGTRSGYPVARVQRLFEEITERAKGLPGVVSVSPGYVSPLSGDFSIGGIRVPGYVPQPNETDAIAFTFVGPEYFRTLGAPLMAGRPFDERDGPDNKVAIVNQKTAAHYWPGESAVGKHLHIGGIDGECEVVGVVKDEKTESLREDAQAIVYFPFRLNFRSFMALHVRVAGNTSPVMSALLREVRALDRTIPVRDVTTMAAQLDRTILLDRLMATLTAIFGGLGAVLAAVGLYGVMAFTVAARTRESGIRMALGADRGRVMRKVIGESAMLTAGGIGVGVAGALWASRAAASFLYGLSATDPGTYAVLAIALGLVALAAAWIPARRASMVDPMVALRYE
jgi:predicted permease